MKRPVLIAATTLAMVAFASNSLLCRSALRELRIDAASFTAIRLMSGALVLWLMLRLRGAFSIRGSWASALALFVYAAAFSLAYLTLPAGIGALILFAAVQGTMILSGLCRGEQLRPSQWFGILLAFAGLIWLLRPGFTAPPLAGSALMFAAGIAWGVYSLRGKGEQSPISATAGNFLRAAPMTILLSLICAPYFLPVHVTQSGLVLATVSGAITSGLGYVIWYAVLPSLRATSAATVQLSAPVIAAVGAVLFLSEPLTWRLVLAGLAVLGGIATVVLERRT
jgi:drug/metabolite transporter (DMT)-like permease